jgi:hypothetical protein
MSLNIKNEETNRLAHELAGLTGESLTTRSDRSRPGAPGAAPAKPARRLV